MFLIHITTEGERWDQLANRYYGNPLQYEPIVAANPDVSLSPILPSGLSLAIPLIEQEDLSQELPPWLK